MVAGEKKYILLYFNYRGRAEPVRYIFAYANIPYDDVRYTDEQWKLMKPETPFGQLPVLVEIDGPGNTRQLCQARAICRYLGDALDGEGEKLFNTPSLAAQNTWGSARVDEITSCIDDVMFQLERWWKEDEEAKKTKMQQNLKNDIIPQKLRSFEKLSGFTGESSKTFLLGDRPTWADFYVVGALEVFEDEELLASGGWAESSKSLGDYIQRVQSLPGVKEWIEKRPKTPF